MTNGDTNDGDPVSDDEAILFAALLNSAMMEWVQRTGRDEIPVDLAEKVVHTMNDVTLGEEPYDG